VEGKVEIEHVSGKVLAQIGDHPYSNHPGKPEEEILGDGKQESQPGHHSHQGDNT